MNVALQRAGRATPPPEVSRDERPISREELEECLSEFAAFVAGDKRMAFWVSDGNGGHKWTPSPEGVAKNLVHTALKMRFRARIEVFEEIAAGAGRTDLYLRCQGGLAVIVELKMLGAPYSSTYAFSGQDQVVHYMESKGVNWVPRHLRREEARLRGGAEPDDDRERVDRAGHFHRCPAGRAVALLGGNHGAGSKTCSGEGLRDRRMPSVFPRNSVPALRVAVLGVRSGVGTWLRARRPARRLRRGPGDRRGDGD